MHNEIHSILKPHKMKAQNYPTMDSSLKPHKLREKIEITPQCITLWHPTKSQIKIIPQWIPAWNTTKKSKWPHIPEKKNYPIMDSILKSHKRNFKITPQKVVITFSIDLKVCLCLDNDTSFLETWSWSCDLGSITCSTFNFHWEWRLCDFFLTKFDYYLFIKKLNTAPDKVFRFKSWYFLTSPRKHMKKWLCKALLWVHTTYVNMYFNYITIREVYSVLFSIIHRVLSLCWGFTTQ